MQDTLPPGQYATCVVAAWTNHQHAHEYPRRRVGSVVCSLFENNNCVSRECDGSCLQSIIPKLSRLRRRALRARRFAPELPIGLTTCTYTTATCTGTYTARGHSQERACLLRHIPGPGTTMHRTRNSNTQKGCRLSVPGRPLPGRHKHANSCTCRGTVQRLRKAWPRNGNTPAPETIEMHVLCCVL